MQFKKLIWLGLWLVAMQACQPTETTQKTHTNIVYILADDLGYGDIGALGQSHFETPHIDKLAKSGMLFTRHYAGTTVCAPSRSALMTGLHTGHTYIRGNKGVKPEGQFPIDSEAVTVAEILKENGYTTGAFGKWGLGFPGSEGDPNFQGFDEFFGYNCQSLAHNYFPYHLWENQTKVMLKGNADSLEQEYAPDLIHAKALQFIEDNKDRPFFLYYPTTIPHAELRTPNKEMEPYRGKYLPEKEYSGAKPGDERYKKGAYGSQKESHAAFAAMVGILDRQVGEVMDKLKALGLEENTLVIFTSDNGPHLEGGADPDYFDSNGPLRGYKRDLYEGGIREPFIASWKGHIKPNTVTDHVSAFWDFLPTVCELLDIPAPENTDGLSFLPTLEEKEQAAHDYLYWEFLEQGGKQAVLFDDWKCIKLNVNNPEKTHIELYNLKDDIGETQNLAEAHPDLVKKALELMQESHTYNPNFHFTYEEESNQP
ncbi:arylsulfatase [Marinilongibacter aquaticus]|uniref:arylsulfatase n=1 Tax=Marinilongibacter aquaticus TaxID=2975157 RepID=UPI0021BDE18D|nr:arylsulfatase [Marinilongibacter aquaticus]UBM58391.1 arylsulfatase [Marinilongibacter aquaticus]